MARKYFGTDGIRGLANGHKLTPDLAMRVGMAAGLKFARGDHRNRVVIGKDTRRSGYMIENALAAGFTAVGMDVYFLGPMPTPAVAMLTRSLRADLGVMISASHNPFDDNGIKLFGPDGFKLSDEIETQIEELMDGDIFGQLSHGRDIGRAHRDEAAQTRYIEYAKRTLPKNIDLTGLRVVIDCANGAGYKVAPVALWELCAEVVPIGVEPNVFNINDEVGSTATAAIQAKVKEVRADIGIALDGDADRVVIVDERGEVVDGDQLMAVIAQSWHARGELRGNGIVATIMSNLGLERYLGSLGLGLNRTKVGDRYVLEHARQRLQCRRRAVGPHHPLRLHHHGRRAGGGAATARRGQGGRPARLRGVPPLREGAAAADQCALQGRQAARPQAGRAGHRRKPRPARQGRPPRHPRIGHRAGDPRHGRERRRRPRRRRRRTDCDDHPAGRLSE